MVKRRKSARLYGEDQKDLPKVPGPEPAPEPEPEVYHAGGLTRARQNWNSLPLDLRSRCLDHLRRTVPQDYVATLASWYRRTGGFRQVPDEFHTGAGMFIRNTLRRVVSDANLPPIKHLDGTESRGWSGYYTGAIEEFVEATQ